MLTHGSTEVIEKIVAERDLLHEFLNRLIVSAVCIDREQTATNNLPVGANRYTITVNADDRARIEGWKIQHLLGMPPERTQLPRKQM